MHYHYFIGDDGTGLPIPAYDMVETIEGDT